jgi:AraC-like DNA-binding protein
MTLIIFTAHPAVKGPRRACFLLGVCDTAAHRRGLPRRPLEMPRTVEADASRRRLALPASGFDSRAAIEGYLERLNRSSPLAQRDITQWGGAATQHLRVAAVPLAAIGAPDEVFMGEAQTSFALDVRAQRPAAAGAPYSVGLLLASTMRVTLADGEHVAHAGEGVIVDPAEVERTQFSVDSHFLEFALPRQQLLRLGAELAPGELPGTPGFACVLKNPVAQRLLVMATQTADVLCAGRPPAATRVMFQRWIEMIGLTLLYEQQHAGSAALAQGGHTAGAPPRSVSRALDFIDAHAQADILLADIAAAACVSASTLLRQFNEHVGQTPAAFLRQVRLDRARAELRRGHAGSIRELAQRWGFQSPGKFSQAYLQRFGERPGAAR